MSYRMSRCGIAGTHPSGIREDVGSIPGLASVGQGADVGMSCGADWQLQLQWDP